MNGTSMSVIKDGSMPVPGMEYGTEMITTRFGEVMIQKDNPIFFPRGLLGMPDKFHFCLTNFPTGKLNAQFKLLQSLDDYNLSFIALPLELQNNILDEADIREAAAQLEIPLEQLTVALLVSVHRGPQAIRLSANARAPLFMNSDRRLAVQHVFPHDKYKVQRMISV